MNPLYLLTLLQVLDLVSTVVALQNPKLKEGNGLLKQLMDRFGVLPALIGVKLVFLNLILLAAPLVYVEVLYLLCVFYAWVVFNNIKLIRSN